MSAAQIFHPRMQDTFVGKPIQYTSGPFAGRTIRSELSEYQKPDLGRKFAKRDRRPVDPPPVVRIRMFETKDAGTPNAREEELHAGSIDISGLVAHVDLFPVNPDDLRQPQPGDHPSGSGAVPGGPTGKMTHGTEHRHGQRLDEPTIWVDEGSKLTQAVFGSSFVHAVQVDDMSGEHVIMFVFADLSVKVEGHFVYRYRSFDLFGRVAGSEHVPIAAELFSGVFVIYSTKEFPGLQASTPLTKHLGRWGVRVNLRETSRRRKGKKGEDDDEDDEGSSGGGDLNTDDDRQAQFYNPNFLAPYAGQASTSRLASVAFGAPLGYDQYGQPHSGERALPPPPEHNPVSREQ